MLASSDESAVMQTESALGNEVSISMNVSLPECRVVLRRLTEEEINPNPLISDASSFELSGDSLDAFYRDFERSCKQRRLRRQNRPDEAEFEMYKKHREQFFSKRKKNSKYADESFSVYMSRKKKKRAKRIQRYEADTEWNPSVSNHLKSKRRLVRRPAIESDSSSTDEEEFYFDSFENDKEELEYLCQSWNPVPSDATSSDQSALPRNDSIDGENIPKELKQAQLQVRSDSTNVNGDILSGIMKEMDSCVRPSKTKSQKTRLATSGERGANPPRKRVKRLKSDYPQSEELVVRNIITLLLNKVCEDEESLEKSSKSCRWCKSSFTSTNPSEFLCAVCYDLGREKYFQKSPVKISKLKQPLPGKKRGRKPKSVTMSQVLKKIPKNERQRLLYSDKKCKELSKGYSHCKTVPESSNLSPETLDETVSSNKNTDGPEAGTKSIPACKSKKTPKKKSVGVKRSATTEESRPFKRKASKPVEEVQYQNENLGSKVSLKKFDEGLFQISFPGRDDDLVNIVPSKPSSSQKKNDSKPSKFNGSCATDTLNASAPTLGKNTSNQTNKDEQCREYLIPPVPTVLVANYSSAGSDGSYKLSSIFYQNKYTQNSGAEKSQNGSIVPILPANNVPVKSSSLVMGPANRATFTVLPTSANSNQIAPVSLNVTNMAALAVTTVPLNAGLSQMQPFMNNGLSISVSQPVQSSVLSMPVVSSVVSLCDKSAGDKIQNSENFVNSEQLQIKITSVESKQMEETQSSNCVNEKVPKSQESRSENSKDGAGNSPERQTSSDQSSTLSTDQDSGSNKTVDQKSDASGRRDSTQDSADKGQNKPQDAISSASDLLDSISILAVTDLDPKGSHVSLNSKMYLARSELARLSNEKNNSPEHNAKIASMQHHIKLLKNACTFLNRYGSFAKVSEWFLRRYQMIQIKKEKLEEGEENQSACQFSKSNHSTSFSYQNAGTASLSQVGDSLTPLQNALITNPIEQLQTLNAAINNPSLQSYNSNFPQYDMLRTSTVNHFPVKQVSALSYTTGAPTPITPNNDGEARETPSRGSGPRTPARPESAASQPEELAITALKKELMEVSTSPCAFSQTTSVNPIPSQMSTLRDIVSFSTSASIPSSLASPIMTNAPTYQQKSLPLYNQNYSNVLLNVPSTTPVYNSVDSNSRQLLTLQNASVVAQKQTVPSFSNQYVNPPTSVGGAIFVNSLQVQNPSMNALLSNVSNQQFYTSSQVPQMYSNLYTPQPQVTQPAVTNQPSPIETKEQMYCAVCKNVATLRCKQCAKVAYCNTACAKTYWHQRHKMECKPVPSIL